MILDSCGSCGGVQQEVQQQQQQYSLLQNHHHHQALKLSRIQWHALLKKTKGNIDFVLKYLATGIREGGRDEQTNIDR
jgi:hypothetical protein